MKFLALILLGAMAFGQASKPAAAPGKPAATAAKAPQTYPMSDVQTKDVTIAQQNVVIASQAQQAANEHVELAKQAYYRTLLQIHTDNKWPDTVKFDGKGWVATPEPPKAK